MYLVKSQLIQAPCLLTCGTLDSGEKLPKFTTLKTAKVILEQASFHMEQKLRRIKYKIKLEIMISLSR